MVDRVISNFGVKPNVSNKPVVNSINPINPNPINTNDKLKGFQKPTLGMPSQPLSSGETFSSNSVKSSENKMYRNPQVDFSQIYNSLSGASIPPKPINTTKK